MRAWAGGCLVLALAACRGGSSTTGTAATARPASTPRSCDALPRTGGSDAAAMLLDDVRVAGQPDSDRVVFELKPREDQPALVPHFEVKRATPPLTQDASGEEIKVEGRQFLSVVMFASGVDLGPDRVTEVYTGPKQIKASGTSTIREVRHAGDFENVLTWYVGAERLSCVRVSTLSDPIRLVIDAS